MARIRTIKPDFFKNEQLAALTHAERLLFIGLWTLADRSGRLEDRPRRIRTELFPYEPDVDVDAGLQHLADAGLVVRYAVDGQRLVAIPTWHRHQQPHIRERASELPPPPSDDGEPAGHGTVLDLAAKHGASTVLTPVQPVGREGKGREGSGKDRGRERIGEGKGAADLAPRQAHTSPYVKEPPFIKR